LVRQIEVGSLTIGLLAFTQWRNASEAEFAGRVTTADGIGNRREAARSADLVCALPHWDFEFRHFPHTETRALARRLAEEAGLVVGGHAHVVQPVERIGDAFVAYGLGDFLGTALPRVPWPLRIGAMLSVEVSADDRTKGEIACYRLVPFVRERRERHERLVPIEKAGVPGAPKTRDRLALIFASGQKPRKSL
jgi:poly-gamma-glutamate synthesis protein (capsule biosynthesis protein)